jgi:hypothetical protein
MNPHVIISFELEKICSICHQKSLQTLGRHGIFKGIPANIKYRYKIVIMNSLSSIAPQIDSIKRRSNYLRANMLYHKKDLFFKNKYFCYKSFKCNYILTTHHRLFKYKLKLCQRVSTAYTVTLSSNWWG